MLGNANPFPRSVKNLDQRVGNSRIKDFLYSLSDRDFAYEKYDFNVQALDTTNVWTVAAGGTASTWVVQPEAGGWIRGVTGATTASAALQLSQLQKYWTGAAGAGVAFLYRANVVEGLTLEMGFVDALASLPTTIINNATTPTFNTAVDVAMYLYQHTGGATAVPNRVGLYTNNSSSGVAQKSVQTITPLGALPGPAAATEHFVAIELQGTTALCWTGAMDAPLTITNAVTAANGVRPFFAVKGANSTSKNVDIDCIITWSGRLG